jgi:hypothetical protein
MGYYNRINLFIPTFRRISCGRFIKCVRSAISQADDIKNICITVLINEDDDESQEYFKNPVDLIKSLIPILFLQVFLSFLIRYMIKQNLMTHRL